MSRIKRGATNLCGILAVDKPTAMTSHDVVNAIRRITQEGRVGHAGTLDPLATGLLLVCIGPATRLSELLTSGDKGYEARIAFGSATDTDDAQGTVIARAPLTEALGDGGYARGVLQGFIGIQKQMPPRYAAIKKEGKKAYEAAREGRPLELDPRTVTVHDLRLIEATQDHWDIEALVSKGTYIRALARDIGEAVGCKAHVLALRRTRSGQALLAQAHTLKDLEEAWEDQRFTGLFLDPCRDLGIPQEAIPEGLRDAFSHG